jgi:hypothetical protein
MSFDLSHARPHDLGGQPAGPIDRTEHAAAPWHDLVTAVFTTLRPMIRVDEVRRAIEDLPAEDYRRLAYFERWSAALSTLVVEKGLLSREEIERRIAELGQPEAGAHR